MPVFGVRRDCRATREGKESEFFWFSSADRGDCADRVSRGDPHRQSGRHHGQAPALNRPLLHQRRLNAELTRQVEENTELQRLYSAGESDEYIERIARDRLGYVAPDERIFIDMSGE